MTLIQISNYSNHQRTTGLVLLLSFILSVISCASQNGLAENNLLTSGVPEDLKSFEKFIWSKSSENTLVINKKNLNRIYKATKTGEDVYFDFLRSYSNSLTNVKSKIAKNLSFSERAYVAGHIVEYLYKCQKKFKEEDPYKDSNFIYRLLAPWDINNYNREFKMHDYYGLKLLKKHHLEHYKYFPDV